MKMSLKYKLGFMWKDNKECEILAFNVVYLSSIKKIWQDKSMWKKYDIKSF